MSVKFGNNIVAKSSTYHPDLFDIKWSDHMLDNISWLRADTFSWHSGKVYTKAYQHLLADINNQTLQSETIGDITIQYYLARDGHKIVDTENEEAVQQLFATTGIAWYYIIDTTNQRFKLPRTKYAFTGIRDNVGKFVEAGLPNATGTLSDQIIWENGNATGIMKKVSSGSNFGHAAGDYDHIGKYELSLSNSNSIYGNSDTVQPQATEMYLYFYIGNFVQKDITTTYGPEFMAHQAMPSDRYVDLTLGASESTYTAPADGYFTISLQGTSDNNVHYVIMSKTRFEAKESNTQLDEFCTTTLAVRKDDKMLLRYNNVVMNTSSGCYFCFVYAEGSK